MTIIEARPMTSETRTPAMQRAFVALIAAALLVTAGAVLASRELWKRQSLSD